MSRVTESLRFAAMLVAGAIIFAQAAAATKQDSSKPIEITADAFEVFQQESRAVFTGHVIATQGQMRLKSDRMTVFYRSGAQSKGGASGISRINVDGNVLLVSPQETASGEKGVYNVDTKIVTLDGNVVLTRDKNVLKGASLVYDLNSGKSELKGGAPLAADAKDGAKPGRVRALFIPGDATEKPKNAAK